MVPFYDRILVSASICGISFAIYFPCSWFVSVSCWHNSTMASFVVVIFWVYSWFTLDVSLSSLNMSLMLSSDTTFFSLRFDTLFNPNPPCHLVVPLLLCVELLKVGLARCLCLVCVRLSSHLIILSSPNSQLVCISSTACVTFCESSQLIPIFPNRSWSLCNFVKYTAMSSSGFHGKSVSFNFYLFIYLFVNYRRCSLIWSSISFANLCVKSITSSLISSSHDLL